jgi:hypothetical protein
MIKIDEDCDDDMIVIDTKKYQITVCREKDDVYVYIFDRKSKIETILTLGKPGTGEVGSV